MLEKLILFLLQAKHLAVVGVLATGVVVTGTFGGQAVDLVIRPLTAAATLDFPDDPLVDIDEPAVGARIDGDVVVSGFAIDRNATTGTGIEDVKVYLDGMSEDDLLGTATYGDARASVADEFGDQFELSGWTFTWEAGDLEGNHTLFVVARSDEGNRTSYVSREVNDPLVSFDSPADNAKVKGLVTVMGWAIDRTAETGAGIKLVTLYLDSTSSTALGEATLGGASDDVADLYGSEFNNAGWTFDWDTTAVEPGKHTLYAVATSDVSEHTTTASLDVIVQEDEEDDASAGPGCSEWAHDRNEAWKEVQTAWKTSRADLDALKLTGKADKDARTEVAGLLRTGRDTMDAARQTGHIDIQALAHSNHCATDLDYSTIVETAVTAMETAATDAETDVAAALAAATTTSRERPDKGPKK